MASAQPEWIVVNVLRVLRAREVQATLSYVSSRAIPSIECTTVEHLTKALDAFLVSSAAAFNRFGSPALQSLAAQFRTSLPSFGGLSLDDMPAAFGVPAHDSPTATGASP